MELDRAVEDPLSGLSLRLGASFQFVIDQLQRDWRVIAPDWRGYGDTEWGPGDAYWFPDYLGDLDALLHHMLEDPLVQWAWSPGARLKPGIRSRHGCLIFRNRRNSLSDKLEASA